MACIDGLGAAGPNFIFENSDSCRMKAWIPARSMNLTNNFLNALAESADRTDDPLGMMWPMPNNPATWVSFSTFDEWLKFVSGLQLRHAAPKIAEDRFERALKLFLLAWLDFDLIKAAELQALTTLEFALTDCYGDKVRDKKGKIYFYRLLRYLPTKDDLTDDKLPLIRRCGGSVVERLKGNHKPTLADIRNDLAHGLPFTDTPQAGLIELVRDLIDYAYRDWPK